MRGVFAVVVWVAEVSEEVAARAALRRRRSSAAPRSGSAGEVRNVSDSSGMFVSSGDSGAVAAVLSGIRRQLGGVRFGPPRAFSGPISGRHRITLGRSLTDVRRSAKCRMPPRSPWRLRAIRIDRSIK